MVGPTEAEGPQGEGVAEKRPNRAGSGLRLGLAIGLGKHHEPASDDIEEPREGLLRLFRPSAEDAARPEEEERARDDRRAAEEGHPEVRAVLGLEERARRRAAA